MHYLVPVLVKAVQVLSPLEEQLLVSFSSDLLLMMNQKQNL